MLPPDIDSSSTYYLCSLRNDPTFYRCQSLSKLPLTFLPIPRGRLVPYISCMGVAFLLYISFRCWLQLAVSLRAGISTMGLAFVTRLSHDWLQRGV